MINGLYSIKDIVVGSFYEIKIYPNDESAIRDFDLLCKQAKFPQDLQFYKLGTYNSEDGKIEPSCEFLKAGAINELS